MHLQVSCMQLHGVLRSLTFHETESVLMIEFGIGILAGVLPARRAAQVEPTEALRT